MNEKLEKIIDFISKSLPISTILFTFLGGSILYLYQYHIKIFPYIISHYSFALIISIFISASILFSLMLLINAISCFWIIDISNSIFFKKKNFFYKNSKINYFLIYALSISLSLILMLNFYLNDSKDSNFIFIYFAACGFFICSIIYSANKDYLKLKNISLFALMVIASLSLLPVSAGTLPRVFIRFLGFHTSNGDQVFINNKIIPEIDNRLKLYGQKSKLDCSVDIDGKTFHHLIVQNSNLPLVVLWNDGSDKRVIGFDKSLIENKEAYFPAMFINADDVRELSSDGLICKK
ncbi:hypothetical protein FBY50_1648 [Zymomonas mobilis]|uniref:hypothetical protein n=1 Tax=Zymomonas mobilis TaxID=542 RepID=UPI000B373E58|nr:hypothetical protein [Zymomonas mobilis]ART94054.1 hypothetical protein B9T50_08000 [Zymomonas mobilis subsp. mobilis]TWD60799.1 hypothetical protein FBY50_1648 [Zymomonas mobilis]